VDLLKNNSWYPDLGVKIPKGTLLVGPPGSGKTLWAKAVAGEADVPFFSVSATEFVEVFAGIGASRVRDVLTDAKTSAPCIIFIDGIDSVSRQRSAAFGQGDDEGEQTVNQLLKDKVARRSRQGPPTDSSGRGRQARPPLACRSESRPDGRNKGRPRCLSSRRSRPARSWTVVASHR